MQHNYGNNGNSMAGSPVSQAAGIVTSSEPISSASVFNFTDRLPIFSYLVSSNRIRWYRVIMRFFLQCHRELYRYQLTAQEVRDTLRETFDSEYTLEQCQNDLAALKEWGNITTIYDSSRATSIRSGSVTTRSRRSSRRSSSRPSPASGRTARTRTTRAPISSASP